MKISATSALVLNWSAPELWQTPNATTYCKQLDLSEGDALLQLFSAEENFMHLQAVSGRKFFMKKKVISFLNNLHQNNNYGQVIILAAGIAPLSIEIASLFPTSKVFDIDKFLMHEKASLVNGRLPNIKFIHCDITNIDGLKEKLIENGFDPEVPSIVIMEGIVYYITPDDLTNILKFFRQFNVVFACDFCLNPELVNDKTQMILTEVFRRIKELVQLDFIKFYSEQEIIKLIRETGFEKVVATNMQESKRNEQVMSFHLRTKIAVGLN